VTEACGIEAQFGKLEKIMSTSQPELEKSLSVFFDGSCPLCVREVAVYRSAPTPSVHWVDVSDTSAVIPLLGSGVQPQRSALLARFHVRTAKGEWLDGARAFTELWGQLGAPWRALAFVCRLPGATSLLELGYGVFLRWRPKLQSVAHELARSHTLPSWIVPAIRSDQAGETGAVQIYNAMLRFGRDRSLHPMLLEHLEQENRHLDALNALLPWKHRSRLLPVWRLAGYLTGLIPALLGTRWMLATIASVERFVDQHYKHQINALEAAGGHEALLEMLVRFRADELRHRDDAIHSLEAPDVRNAPSPSWMLSVWQAAVGRGSALAVEAAKRI
jgi:demethoxyubiquinone hydroxylase (CLK1/Coq7/Cat5 family)